MTRLILIRHGETVWNREHRMQGQQDSPLTEVGERQARQLGRRFRDEKFGALYSSDLGRAHRTAQSVADATGRSIIVDTRLRERHFGVFEGLTGDEIERNYPREFLCFRSRDPAYAVPGGESALQFRERCLACLNELAGRHAGERVVVVTHGLVLDILYRAANALTLEQPRPVPLLNASLNIFGHDGKRWHCEAWGDVAHLEAAAVTRFESGMA
ncbi:MAG: histidine phosphatase family protein [Pseudomonadota bacterium]